MPVQTLHCCRTSCSAVTLCHGAIRGYTSYTYETLDPEKQTEPDTKEGLYFGREVPEDSEEARTRPLHGPNQWPDEARACPSLSGAAVVMLTQSPHRVEYRENESDVMSLG